jgi:hypothetical protein
MARASSSVTCRSPAAAMTVRCSEASAAPHHGAARDTAGQDRPLPKRIGQTFSAPARRGSATSSKTSARRDPPGLYQSASPYAERAGDERDADREHGRRSADQCAARSLDCVQTHLRDHWPAAIEHCRRHSASVESCSYSTIAIVDCCPFSNSSTYSLPHVI